ncbi:MAG: sigma 54-interacting transcriptional regulator [Planctomycetaceae bacterium]
MAATWLKWSELSLFRDGGAQGTLLQLCDRILAQAAKSKDGARFRDDQLKELSAELSLQWAAVVERTPEWQTLAEVGRHSLDQTPQQFWAEALDREAAGFTDVGEGWATIAVPMAFDSGPTRLLVGLSRKADAELLTHAHFVARALSLGMTITDRCLGADRRIDRLQTTLKIASKLSMARETQPLLETIAEEATRMVDCDRSSIFLWDRDRKEVIACPALGVDGGTLRLPDSGGIVGETLRTGRAIQVDHPYDDPRFNQEVDRKSGYRTENLICVPLLDGEERLVGAFQGLNKHDGAFTAEDELCLRQLGIQAAIALRHLEERDQLERNCEQLTDRVTQGVRLIGESASMVALRDTISRLAMTDLPVLILGESGTGKEVCAQSLHYQGPRHDSPFVAVNCAALTETLLESELFGHEKGSFTDAHEMRQGKFELAAGGTLFLDEIGDMSLGGQAKLLRVLEQKVITRVGGSQPIPIDTRVVAATNANLAEFVRERKFREDLYYRLSVVTLDLPALRDRPEDILPLAESFLKQFAIQAKRPNLSLSAEARRRVQAHSWPGNVRELRNLMERVAFLSSGERVEVDDLAFILSPEQDNANQPSLDLGLDRATRAFQCDYIQRAIKRVGGNMSEAARLLGLHRSNLYRKMRQLEMGDGEKAD